MKIKVLIGLMIVFRLLAVPGAIALPSGGFPFDPYSILKTWHYDQLVRTMGNGEEILSKFRNQTYISGLSYPFEFMGMTGKLTFNFNKDSISMIQFRKEHPERIVTPETEDRIIRDTVFRKEFNAANLALDSLRRDSIVRRISEIMGTPVSSGKTSPTEKNSRYSAIWINQGYSCLYKDYLTYSEVVFTLATIPMKTVGEFNIPAGTEIISRQSVSTRRLSWTASLLGYPAIEPTMTYSEFFLLIEFSTGQKFLENLQKNPEDYLRTFLHAEFPLQQRSWISLPNRSIGYLPEMRFDDLDGDAIPEAWIEIAFNQERTKRRHMIFAMPLREPIQIFSSDELCPRSISTEKGGISIIQADGNRVEIKASPGITLPDNSGFRFSNQFIYLKQGQRNTDGSTNFTGGLELIPTNGLLPLGILEIEFRHQSGGWETGKMEVVPMNRSHSYQP